MTDTTLALDRGGFIAALGVFVDQARAAGDHLGLLLIDLSNLRLINHRHGYEIGDHLLLEAGQQLLAISKLPDTVFRIGGHSFAFILPQLDTPAFIALALNRVQRLLDETLQIDDEILPLQLRIGLAVNLQGKHSPMVTLARAESSLTRVKQGSALEIDALIGEEEHAQEGTALEQHFSEALYDNAFDLYFQPKVDLQTGRVCSAEALIRWHLPGYGAVSPERVVQLAEAAGQTYELTRWVVNRALRAMREWRDTVVLPLAVNIPAGLVNSPDLANMLHGALTIWGVEPSMLTVEVTEGAVIEDKEAGFDNLLHLRELGMGLSIDDFGTGYSSLSYFKHIPATEIKIDQSFVRRILDDPQDRALVGIIIEIAHLFGFSVVAEGVEDAESLQCLRELGCDIAQGYLFSRPLPEQELLTWLRQYDGAFHD
ncbi:bifunctional diguanylate cyclase/phosphodiesterase [Haliea sp. E1-2-M8]|uniref:putative bifunctional diguanylate cyclase/phosphodiesterase n=1 Tax=Haliea sp. E1-2-M8 TaxID=3064706 RepID=UPI0027179DCD|nr:bifunctional diguanylate cyclase/phosphodiesterase [Haliea sp. E1-2-M8]MDO8862609.1 bifunctional diguanylate cyclase/phosphodiesterase [Haliea sp. E1-2-M8]